MELGQIVMAVVIVAGLAGYWWFKVGRRGGTAGYMRHKLGLREGEAIASMWTGYYDIDRTTGEKLGEIVGVRTRGANVMVALTSMGRLAIGNNEQDAPPIGLERGQVSVAEYSQPAEIGSLAGPNGLEKAQVMVLTPVHGAPLRIQIAASGLQSILAWSRGAV